MNKFRSLLAATLLLLSTSNPAYAIRYNKLITVAAGTAVQVSTTHVIVRAIFIQMQHGCSSCGVGYVMDGVPVGTTPSSSTAGTVTAELSPATATVPGGSYTYTKDGQGGIDLALIWVDGSHSGDGIIVSWDTVN